ncbi:MAG: hypothetical protein RMJ37_01720 [Spirochaetia bacterium]|nr:hypothetical protein [Spirochaetota bacterium]MCX8096594.1 hypothetical protein [Spirochaetota bacterium]MDW8112041.1 hypothetical protein [Spirochaetia bacterium]
MPTLLDREKVKNKIRRVLKDFDEDSVEEMVELIYDDIYLGFKSEIDSKADRSEIKEELQGIRSDIKVLSETVKIGFENINKRFEDNNKRFEDINKRFEDINKRFEDINKRFEDINRRIGFLQWLMVFLFGIFSGIVTFISSSIMNPKFDEIIKLLQEISKKL